MWECGGFFNPQCLFHHCAKCTKIYPKIIEKCFWLFPNEKHRAGWTQWTWNKNNDFFFGSFVCVMLMCATITLFIHEKSSICHLKFDVSVVEIAMRLSKLVVWLVVLLRFNFFSSSKKLSEFDCSIR